MSSKKEDFFKQISNWLAKSKNTAVLVKPDGTTQPVQVRNLKDMQKYVGGYIIPYRLPYKTDFVILVDEDGLLKRLPVNEQMREFFDIGVVGNALIINKKIWG